MIIGLTGNIGSGKSSVRKMLEHKGALGIDADRIAKDALKKESPAFPQVIERFGKGIIDSSGEIDRKKLASIVFNDPEKLKRLEEISHPLVSSACKKIIAHSPLPIIVIEAIKLLKSDLAPLCQSIWVVDTEKRAVYQRLKQSRGMSRAEVDVRLAQQSPISEKKKRADIVINNSAKSQDTWQQVQSALALIKTDLSITDTIDFQTTDSHSLKPSASNVEKVKDILQSNPQNILNQILPAQAAGYLSEEQPENWLKDDDQIFRNLCHYHFTQTEKVELVCWEYDHFTCRIAGCVYTDSGMDREDFHFLLEQIERSGKMHLCNQYSIPIKKEEVSFVEEMGYERQQEPAHFGELYKKAGYNLYTKKILYLLSSFKVC